jgi:hypothetical protein
MGGHHCALLGFQQTSALLQAPQFLLLDIDPVLELRHHGALFLGRLMGTRTVVAGLCVDLLEKRLLFVDFDAQTVGFRTGAVQGEANARELTLYVV